MVGNTGVCSSFLLHICGSFKKLIRKWRLTKAIAEMKWDTEQTMKLE